MTIEQAESVADYAKQLFPVTTQERIDAVGVMVLPFPNPEFAKQALRWWSEQPGGDVLSIPKIKERLEADEDRKRQVSEERRESLARDRALYNARREAETADARASFQKINEALDSLDESDLELLKADVLKTHPFLVKSDPKKSPMLRVLMFKLLNPDTKLLPASASSAPRVGSVQRLEFDEEAA